jgi:YVTN family beta-propeller protein
MRLRNLLPILFVLAATACAEAGATPQSTLPDLEPLPVVATTMAEETTTTTLPPPNTLQLAKVETIGGDISPKSVVASGNGLFFAQNMMYRHTVTVYDADYRLVATIPDTVDLSDFGLADSATSHSGAPVEAVPTATGSHIYVSNYRMYGPGYNAAGDDDCNLAQWDESFIYRISTESLEIDQVIPAGAVPKFLAITPDDSLLLASNWCSFDLSVVDTATATEVARIPLGRHPRGIAVTGDGATAYVAVMGSHDVAVVDLHSFDVGWIRGVGANPRHLVLHPSEDYLFATLNGEGIVATIDLETGSVVDRINTGDAPRSMTISDDGQSLYVVNYNSDTVSKIDTVTMEVTQQLAVPHRPIGITFDARNREIWVASYSGAITVFRETTPTQ